MFFTAKQLQNKAQRMEKCQRYFSIRWAKGHEVVFYCEAASQQGPVYGKVPKVFAHTPGLGMFFMKNKIAVSPCVKICKMNPESGFCEGCFRTIDEIAAWGSLNDGRKLQVYKQLEKRKRNAARKAS